MKKHTSQLISVYIFQAVSISFVLTVGNEDCFALFVFMGIAYLMYFILSAQRSWFSWTAYLNFVICSAISGAILTMLNGGEVFTSVYNDAIGAGVTSYVMMLLVFTPLLGFVNFVLWSAHDKPKE